MSTGHPRPDIVKDPTVVEPLDPETGTAYVTVDVGDTIVGLGLYGEPHVLQPFTITRFDVMPHPISRGVTGTLLRDIPVQTCLRVAVHALLGPMPDPGRMAARKSTPEALRVIARTYRVAQVYMESPVSAVAQLLGTSKTTATRWIERARTEGYFEQVQS